MLEIDNIKVEDCERQPCEVYTRCMGYYRPVSQFNIGKKSEFKERKLFEESCIKPSLKTLKGEAKDEV